MTTGTRQATLAGPAELSGVGLHCGQQVRVRLLPAEPGTGICFQRTDLENCVAIRAEHAAVNGPALTRRTELLARDPLLGDITVGMTEHLLGACMGLGIDNLRVELDGPELPILDGSGAPYAAALVGAGRHEQEEPRRIWRLRNTVSLTQGSAEIIATPAESMRCVFFAELRHAGIENQCAAWHGQPDEFLNAIAPARTFVFHEDVEKLRAAGLIRGGTLECAIVLKDGQPWQTEYRLPNELASHKLLDLLGDLAVLGGPIRALITARGTGHALHHAFVERLQEALD